MKLQSDRNPDEDGIEDQSGDLASDDRSAMEQLRALTGYPGPVTPELGKVRDEGGLIEEFEKQEQKKAAASKKVTPSLK